MPLCRYFTHVNEAVLFSRPTYSHFIALLDNYDHSVDRTEHLSDHQWHEIEKFLDVALDTEVMQETDKFLRSKGNVVHFRRRDPREFARRSEQIPLEKLSPIFVL